MLRDICGTAVNSTAIKETNIGFKYLSIKKTCVYLTDYLTNLNVIFTIFKFFNLSSNVVHNSLSNTLIILTFLEWQ
jgi:hypothetical protein